MSILLMNPLSAMRSPTWTVSSMAIVEHLAEQGGRNGAAHDMSEERRFLCKRARAALAHARKAILISVPSTDDLDDMSAPPPKVLKRLVGRVVHVERPKAPCVEDEGEP